jgi:hypothetical protein
MPAFANQTQPSDSQFWISDGKTTVGPVPTDLLLRGVSAGRVPDSCWIIGQGWSAWRLVPEVREVAALRRSSAAHVTEAAELIRLAVDDGERQVAALAGMCTATQAQFGLLHRIVGDQAITCGARGEGMVERLGQPLAALDPVEKLARSGQMWVGAVGEGPLSETLVRRFCGDRGALSGIAIVPIHKRGSVARKRGSVVAFIELGRTDHAFRAGDRELLAAISDAVESADQAS